MFIISALPPTLTISAAARLENECALIVTGFLIKFTHSYNSAFVIAGLAMMAGIFSYVFLIGKVEPMQIKTQVIN